MKPWTGDGGATQKRPIRTQPPTNPDKGLREKKSIEMFRTPATEGDVGLRPCG